MIKIEETLKDAILQMPQKEKDKILLRLIAKDEMLVAKLNHQLLENEDDTLEQRQNLLAEIKKAISFKGRRNDEYYHTPGTLMMVLRSCNAAISQHFKITKDKMGEIELSLTLVNEAFTHHQKMLAEKTKRADNFAEYVVKKAEFILKKLEKIHEDYYVELEREVDKMLAFVHNYSPCGTFLKQIKIPKTWIY
jgi:hypothetical protein